MQIKDSAHPRSLSFANQRKVVILRDQGFAWSDIMGRVENHDWLKNPTNRVLVNWPVDSAAEGALARAAAAGA